MGHSASNCALAAPFVYNYLKRRRKAQYRVSYAELRRGTCKQSVEYVVMSIADKCITLIGFCTFGKCEGCLNLTLLDVQSSHGLDEIGVHK